MSDQQHFETIARRIWQGAKDGGFRGSDPYDGLNSRLLAPCLRRSRLLRLVVIQGVKRSPLDLRPLLRIPPGENPKGLALFLHGSAQWAGLGDTQSERQYLADRLLSLASLPDGRPAFADRSPIDQLTRLVAEREVSCPRAIGWGYDFPWQSRAFLQPPYFPTVVVTSFVLDALEAANSPAFPVAAAAAGRFVAEHLQRYEDADGICFSYSPGDTTRVYNASLFGAKVLAQAAAHSPERREEWMDSSRRAVQWVLSRQRPNGAWVYGEADHWQWVDNLHTGFNLVTIDRVAELLGESRWDESVALGLTFYRQRLFDDDGMPRYFEHSRWPIDPHSFAQGALTFLQLARYNDEYTEFARRILAQGIDELWDERHGGFRFQKHRFYSQPAIHLRWAQAWMFRALCAWLAAT